MYEVTFCDSGKTEELTYDECVELFGEDEFQEVLAGHLPNIVAVDLDYEDEYDGQPDELTEWMDFDPDC